MAGGLLLPAPGWRAAPYHANAVSFDGTNDYLTRNAALVGQLASRQFLVSAWFNFSNNTVIQWLTTSSTWLRLYRTGGGVGNTIRLRASNNGSGEILDVKGSTAITSTSGWCHVLASVNMASSPQIYVYDVAETITEDVFTDAEISFDYSTEWRVGSNSVETQYLSSDVADLMFWIGLSPNISAESCRRLFINANSKPVDPRKAIAVLGTPIIRLDLPTDHWHVNQGSGGSFAENGALTAAASSPSD